MPPYKIPKSLKIKNLNFSKKEKILAFVFWDRTHSSGWLHASRHLNNWWCILQDFETSQTGNPKQMHWLSDKWSLLATWQLSSSLCALNQITTQKFQMENFRSTSTFHPVNITFSFTWAKRPPSWIINIPPLCIWDQHWSWTVVPTTGGKVLWLWNTKACIQT